MQRQTRKIIGVALGAASFVLGDLSAQINVGSDGSDGVLNVTTGTNIDMCNHPNGIYKYVSVNVAPNCWVTFTNANTPVTWLVQSNVTIDGTIDLSGWSASYWGSSLPGLGGPGGFRGGDNATPAGQGPGGGGAGGIFSGGNASYGSLGYTDTTGGGAPAGAIYGNEYLIPLLGGSGGGAVVGGDSWETAAGGGGGGAILIATSGRIQINGTVMAWGGGGGRGYSNSGDDAWGGGRKRRCGSTRRIRNRGFWIY